MTGFAFGSWPILFPRCQAFNPRFRGGLPRRSITPVAATSQPNHRHAAGNTSPAGEPLQLASGACEQAPEFTRPGAYLRSEEGC